MAPRPRDKQRAASSPPRGGRPTAPAARGSWLARNRDALKFLGLFAVLMAAFYLVFYRPPSATGARFTDSIIDGYLAAYASVAGFLLRLVGYEAVVAGNVMTDAASGFAVQVVRGCDAMEATALFVFGVLAFPAPWRKRWLGAAVGAALLAALNLFRILTLFVVGLYSRRLFDLMHVDIWQAVFIILTIALWLVWLRWAMRPGQASSAGEGGAPPAGQRTMLAQVGVFLASFLVVYGLLLSVWPYASKAYSPVFRLVGQTCFGTMGDAGQTRFLPLNPPVGPFDTEVVLRSSEVRGVEGVFEVSSWSVGYMPTVTLVALVLATPIAWRRRLIALLIGLACLVPFIALRIGLPLALEFARPDLPVRQYDFSETWASLLMQAKIAFVEAPASFFVVPIFIWIAATFRRSDWAGLLHAKTAGAASK